MTRLTFPPHRPERAELPHSVRQTKLPDTAKKPKRA